MVTELSGDTISWEAGAYVKGRHLETVSVVSKAIDEKRDIALLICLLGGSYSIRFYALVELSTALFGKPAFQNLICNGHVLADDKEKKTSKSLKNYPPPIDVIDQNVAVVFIVTHCSYYSFSIISDQISVVQDVVRFIPN
ncbi:PREDICTED: isoleucine--tRNA ligase-like [Fragaria vesca subsp. vesca]